MTTPVKYLQFKGLCCNWHRWETSGSEHNLHSTQFFHQSKLGRDVELQNTHIVFFKSPRDVMQVTTLSTQLDVGSGLVDWYWVATSSPFGHLLIDLSPRTDDWLRFCTNTGSIPPKIFYPGPADTVKSFGQWTPKISLLSKFPNHFPTNAKNFSFSLAQKRLSGFFANA